MPPGRDFLSFMSEVGLNPFSSTLRGQGALLDSSLHHASNFSYHLWISCHKMSPISTANFPHLINKEVSLILKKENKKQAKNSTDHPTAILLVVSSPSPWNFLQVYHMLFSLNIFISYLLFNLYNLVSNSISP